MIGYFFFRLAVNFFRFVPMGMLYKLSNCLCFILHKIIKYRKEVIFENLKRSFPEKSKEEIHSITKKFYQNLSDIALEGIKGMTLKQQAIIERYKFVNPELVFEMFQNGQSAIGLVAHYNNWEWGALATAPQIKGQVLGVSKSLHNQYIDRFFKINRARFGAKIIHMDETPRAILNHKDIPTLFVLIADQSPSNAINAHWLKFLNQETAFLTGPDKIARKMNYPVIYFDVQRVRRGFYEIRAIELSKNPKSTKEGEITQIYMEQLENIIRKKPENWLWSHKRWKKKKILKHSSKE